MEKQKVIAIDGLSYVGKSTIARSLAKLTHYTYINTGHMYRGAARLALELGISPEDKTGLIRITEGMKLEFLNDGGDLKTMVNGKDWTKAVDDEAAIRFAPRLAAMPEIRTILTERQRQYAKSQMIIMEGRDIGTVVFPNAEWKFFISAGFEIRVQRMYKRLLEEEKKRFRWDDPKFLEKLTALDESDLNRPVAPLRKAEDAIEYDNSSSPTEEDDALILYYCLKHPAAVQKKFIAHSEETLNQALAFAEKESEKV